MEERKIVAGTRLAGAAAREVEVERLDGLVVGGDCVEAGVVEQRTNLSVGVRGRVRV